MENGPYEHRAPCDQERSVALGVMVAGAPPKLGFIILDDPSGG